MTDVQLHKCSHALKQYICMLVLGLSLLKEVLSMAPPGEPRVRTIALAIRYQEKYSGHRMAPETARTAPHYMLIDLNHYDSFF